ncbi:MAG: acetyltransferase [Thermoleophilia bacterium]
MGQEEKRIVIVGAGGHGREVLGIFLDRGEGRLIAGFCDDRRDTHGTYVDDKPVLGDLQWLCDRADTYRAIIAIGNNARRRELASRLEAAGVEFASAISPHAVISPFAIIGDGAMVCAKSVVNSGARIGRHAIVNVAATVSHDCRVGDYSHLACGVRLAGAALVGVECDLGTGAVVNPQTTVGDRAVVGSGAVVVRNLPGDVVAVGVPARPIRKVGEPAAGKRAEEHAVGGSLAALAHPAAH